jgi:hypothetical protein
VGCDTLDELFGSGFGGAVVDDQKTIRNQVPQFSIDIWKDVCTCDLVLVDNKSPQPCAKHLL